MTENEIGSLEVGMHYVGNVCYILTCISIYLRITTVHVAVMSMKVRVTSTYVGSPLALDPIGSMHIYGCQYRCIYLLLHAYLLRGDMGTRLIVSDGGKGLSQFAYSHQCLHVTT